MKTSIAKTDSFYERVYTIMIYNDIKDYIQDKYGEMIANGIEKHLNENSRIDIYSDSTYSVKSVAVKGLVWQHKEFTENVVLEIRTEAKIIHAYSNNNKKRKICQQRLFFVNMSARLFKGLHEIAIDEVIDNPENQFEPTNVFDEYFLPRITSDNLEEAADGFTKNLCTNALYNEYLLPINDISYKLQVEIIESELPENVFGRVYYRETTAKHRVQIYRFSEEVEREFPRGTIIINKEHRFMGNYGSYINTVAHEFAHWFFHKYFFEVLCLLNDELDQLSCEIFPKLPSIDVCNTQSAFYMAEWQANALATRIAMPKDLFLEAYNICYDKARQTPIKGSSGEYTEMALESAAVLFNVSSFEAKNRAIQLGITEADGVLLSAGKDCYSPISYRRDSLDTNQTYVISDIDFYHLVNSDDSFAELIRQCLFVRVECFVALNSNIYIDSDGDKLTLSSYARNHADECCLIFERHYESNDRLDFGYYGHCYLSKNLTEKTPAPWKADYNNIPKNEILIEHSQIFKEYAEEGINLMECRLLLPDSLGDTLKNHMKHGKYKGYDINKKKYATSITVDDLSELTYLSTKTIINVRNNKNKSVTIGTVCAICIGLHLPPLLSMDLINKAELAFPRTREGDIQSSILLSYFHYDITTVNKILISYGLSPWPSKESAQKYKAC